MNTILKKIKSYVSLILSFIPSGLIVNTNGAKRKQTSVKPQRKVRSYSESGKMSPYQRKQISDYLKRRAKLRASKRK